MLVQPSSDVQKDPPIQNIPVPPGPQNVKSSDEILSELFGAFNATPPPPVVIKQEKESSDASSKKNKKHKKKHKKVKKKKRSSSSDSSKSGKKRKVHKKIKKEKNVSKPKKRKLGKFSASDSDSDSEYDRKSKKKKHNKNSEALPVKTEPISTKVSASSIISSLKETILKETVGKIVDNVIDSTKLMSAILPQPPVQVKVEPSVIKKEPQSKSDKSESSNVAIGKPCDIPFPDVNPEDIPVPGLPLADTFNPDEIPIPKDTVARFDQKDKDTLPVADVFVEDLLDSGINAQEIATKKDTKVTGGKITIQNLKFSQVYEQTVKQIEEEAKRKAEKYEEGELSDSSEEPARSPTPTSAPPSPVQSLGGLGQDDKLTKDKEESVSSKSKKHRHHKKDKHRHRGRSRDRKRSTSKENYRSRSRKDRSLSRERRRHRERARSRSRDLRPRSRSRERRRTRSRERRSSRSRERRRTRSRERRSKDRSKSRDRKRSRERSKSKERSRDKKREEGRKDDKPKEHRNKEDKIDKRKLLEIARRNALSMLKGATPGIVPEQTKVSITSGGKTVNELTDFCKLLSKKDADGHESISSNTSHSSEDEAEQAFHHPFQLRERPNSIVLNIRNSVALPTRSHQEKTAEQSRQLRLQFPVSSGQQHRTTESEWYPVSPKKVEPSTSSQQQVVPLPRPPRPKRVFKDTPDPPSLDIGSIVSQRLDAIRKLQENPKDNEALSLMSSAQQHMQSWAESKQDPPGTFTGSTGVKVLTQAELSSGYQAWARKDQLQTAAPLTGGMGMTLLQKMGWRPGEGLGKHKEGSLQPLMLSVKTDKKGLVAQEELPVRQPNQIVRGPPRVRTLEGKHPVSLLNEYCSRRRYGPPVFDLVDEVGPDHKKYFLFKVKVNGVEYKPAVGSPKKKQARAEAAEACLKAMGVLPK